MLKKAMIMNFLLLSSQPIEPIFSSVILGLLFTALLFLFSFFFVVGIKFCLFYLSKPQKEEQIELPAVKQKSIKKRKKPTVKVRSIVIDPDDLEEIFVRKSS